MPADSHADLIEPRHVNSAGGPLLVAARAAQQTSRHTPPHQHARGQLFGSTQGLLVVATDDGRWVVPATHAVWVPPHRVHGVRTHGPYAGWSAYVDEAACADMPAQPFTLRMSALLREAVLRATQWKGGALDEAQHRVAQVVLDEVRSARAEPLGLPMPRDARLLHIAEGLLHSLAYTLTLSAWGRAAGIAPRTAARRFVDETGFTFAAWRQRARLLQAMAWLAEGMPVTTVAIDLGYDNLSAFIAMFRRALGTTPGRYFDGA
jgi:AraC-like DNA-binding protein